MTQPIEQEAPNYWARQSTILPRELITQYPVTIVGVGAGGYSAARTLAIMGVDRLKLIDPDIVEPANVGAQGWYPGNMGENKVDAAIDELAFLMPSTGSVLTGENRKFDPTQDALAHVVFCCVDSMAARREIWEACAPFCKFFVDGRMSGEVLRMFTVTEENGGRDRYADTLFSDAEAHQTRCTAQTIYYCAGLAASIMCSRYSKWLRGLDVPFEINVDLLSDELWTA